MTYLPIIACAQQMEQQIESHGYMNADVEFTFNYSVYTALVIRFRYDVDSERKFETFRASAEDGEEGITACFTEAEQFLSDLPSIETVRTQDFLTQLGRTIDRARELDLPLSYINPLSASLEAMTENLLEDKRPRNQTTPELDDEMPF